MLRLDPLRNLAFAIAAFGATGSLVACKSEPPNIVVHTAPDSQRDPHVMTVSGTATLEVSPDCADLTMTLTGDAMKPGAAVAKINAQRDALIKAMLQLGLEESDLKVSTMGIDPHYEWIKDRSVFKGYTARITLTASTRRFELLPTMMETAADAGVSSMQSQFRRSDLDELKKQVRERALIAAREKAKQTAQTLGIELGRISAVSEGSASYLYANAYFPRVANDMATLDSSIQSIALGGELQPLTIDVQVTYSLDQDA
jgi:uncharacterized protein YggE